MILVDNLPSISDATQHKVGKRWRSSKMCVINDEVSVGVQSDDRTDATQWCS